MCIRDRLDSVYDQYSIWYASDENSPEENLNQNQLQELLKLALHDLSKKEALVVQLYYVEELNVFEIAAVLEVSTGRISQIKKSAIANLRSYISKSQHID